MTAKKSASAAVCGDTSPSEAERQTLRRDVGELPEGVDGTEDVADLGLKPSV